jgi:hypothetical protein
VRAIIEFATVRELAVHVIAAVFVRELSTATYFSVVDAAVIESVPAPWSPTFPVNVDAWTRSTLLRWQYIAPPCPAEFDSKKESIMLTTDEKRSLEI